MRIRSIRPEFWRSEDIAALDWQTRLLFIGLWSYVDDNGVGRDAEKMVAADLFALEDDPRDTLATVSRGLASLAAAGLITRYTVDDKAYLHITTWSRHQKIDRPGAARYPLPTCDDASVRDALATVSRDPIEPSSPGEGEKGRRGEGEKRKTVPSAARSGGSAVTPITGTRLPDDFAVTDDLRSWAAAEAPHAGPRDHDAFCDYWRAQPGAKGRKTDWPATWRNWMRRASDDATSRQGGRGGRPVNPSTGAPIATGTQRALEAIAAGERLQARLDAQAANGHDPRAVGAR